MFNRNNLPSVPNPFSGARPDGSMRHSQGGYNQGPPPPRRYDQDPRMGGGYDSPQRRPVPSSYDGYDDPRAPGGYGQPQRGHMRGPSREEARYQQGGYMNQGPRGGSGRSWMLRPAKSPSDAYTFGNLVAVSPQDIPPSRDGQDLTLQINGTCVVMARPFDGFPPGQISMSDAQRTWAQVSLTDTVNVEMYDPFSQGGQAYLGSMDIEVGFASLKKRTEVPYDQDDLAHSLTRVFESHIFAPGQRFMMDHKGIPLMLVVKTVQLVDLSEKPGASDAPTRTDPHSRGLLTRHTLINFFKDPKTGINLKASNRRPAANSIIQPNFKFEDMGIGGLDTEFSTIFRRAFASRIFPPGLVQQLGVAHVKGILLFGPPGTGKTLIARQIGKMLNAREPKIVNGPEVLNKFVGASEENIRKLFADAEKEYKEKGDESELHIIIFDELDAVCKQRGSGAGGGTGVGDSVVNQLLSKLDGVDQLNNILLIGMTNRMDMIDDALLRPGRLEVHMEISLPDEHGRQQILQIHTQKIRDNGKMAPDVDLAELARLTKNFSGAEIGGLVKSATSFAFNRHVKVGTMAGISDDVADMKINSQDFHNALEEVKPAFGVSEEELEACLHGGIIDFSPHIEEILKEGKLFVEQVRNPDSTPLFSVLLHGPPGSGKTALAAKIAMESGYPLIKLISPEDMVGFNEAAKVQHLSKIFMDAYKSPLSVIVLDNIERIVDWVPIGPRFSNAVLQTVMVLLRKQPPKGRKLLILATTTQRNTLLQLDIANSFDSDIPVRNVNTSEELNHILRESKALSDQDIQRALGEIGEMVPSDRLGVGVKKILSGIETAKQDTDMAWRFASVMRSAISEQALY